MAQAPVLAVSVVLLHHEMPVWACLVIGGAASLPAAEAMRRPVEVPSRDLARWAERRLRRPRAGGAAPAVVAPREPTWAGDGGLFLDPTGGAGRR